MENQALIISGGGSKGAFAGGVAEYLIRECRRDYRLYVGASTGSLLIPMLALGEIELIKSIYTSVTQEDIFTLSPFSISKNDGKPEIGINHRGIIGQFLRRQITLGDTSALRQLISRTLTPNRFKKLQKSDREVIITVSNLTTDRVEYKSSKECTYEDFCDWMWASACLAPFMSVVEKNDMFYADGGFGHLVPIQEAINRGCTYADVIVLRPDQSIRQNPPLRNAFNVLMRTWDFMLSQIGNHDLLIGQLAAANKSVDLQIYHTPRELTEQAFIFEPEQMKAWWKEGFESAQESSPTCFSISSVQKL